jgi:hypothetical protein
MRIRSTTALVRQSIGWSAALAGLTLALLAGAGPASAKNATPCQIKHSYCSQRCIMSNPGNSSDDKNSKNTASCISRTCDHQFKACAALSGESKDPYHGVRLNATSLAWPRRDVSGSRPGRDAGNRDHRTPRGPRGRGPRPTELTSQSPGSPAEQVRVPRAPLGGGILDNMGGGFGQQGPAATGSPVSTGGSKTSSGPMIIR